MDDLKQQHSQISKFLSFILRHKPEEIGLNLDFNGWADVGELLEKINSRGKPMDFETLELIVENNDKKRFSFNNTKSKIRANQGHSLKIELGYQPVKPPEILFHGTGQKYIDSILASGIDKRNRHHVHLSRDKKTAYSVGQRHGKPVIFKVEAEEMFREGYVFYVSENGVWLTNEVPVKYLKILEL